MDPYIAVLHEIVTRELNTNSYKFALWRALASLAPTTDKETPKISKRELAPLFLGYYWPLEVKYHIRQGTDPDKDPIVMTLVRKLVNDGRISHGERLRDFQRRIPQEHEKLLRQVARDAFNDVIPRFHIVRGVPIDPAIFTPVQREGNVDDTVELTSGGRQFLIKYRKLIDYVAVSGWVRFTEGFTSAPRLHDKIEGVTVRKAVSQWRDLLTLMQGGRCFYDEIHDMTSPEVDHVLPWSFVLEDKTWNLVLACRNCNNEKRDRLTSTDALGKLCARNDQITKGLTQADPKFLRHFAEWRSRDLSSHVVGLYDQAVADKFPKWK